MRADPPHGNVLVVVEDADAGEQIGRVIAATGERPWIVRGDSGLSLAREHQADVDLVITDVTTDHLAGRITLKRLLSGEIFPTAPRIHLFRDESMRQELDRGGLDAATLSMQFPPDPSELKVRVRLGAEVGRLRREVERRETHDALTGLSNRRYLLTRLDEELARARRYRSPLSLVVFDIDHLGRINDHFGHVAGDSVIQQLAEVVRGQVRKEDVAGRWVGATIAVVLPGNGFRGAATLASKVRTDAEGIHLEHGGQVHQVHVSAGITTYPDSPACESVDRLVRAAEGALLSAKTRGGNRVFIDEEVLRHERRVILVADPDSDVLDLTEDLLTVDDFQVVRAESVRAVLETLRFRRPDLLVIDLQMAEHEGATPLIEQIHSLFPSAGFPIIGLAKDGGTSAEQISRFGVDRFITKPFSMSLLVGAARDLLG